MFINSIFFQVIGWQVIFPSSGFYFDILVIFLCLLMMMLIFSSYHIQYVYSYS